MDAFSIPLCHRGTKEDVLQEITEWVMDDKSHQNILWLYGLAGSGKSTIAATISKQLGALNRRGAFLFFKRERADQDPKAVFHTVAANHLLQLNFASGFAEHIFPFHRHLSRPTRRGSPQTTSLSTTRIDAPNTGWASLGTRLDWLILELIIFVFYPFFIILFNNTSSFLFIHKITRNGFVCTVHSYAF